MEVDRVRALSALASRIACRSDPAPLSLVLVTSQDTGATARQAENSEVLLLGSVAVAVTAAPTVVSGMLAVKLALPVPSVVADIDAQKGLSFAVPGSVAAAFEKNSRRKVVFAPLFRVPRIVVTVPLTVAALSNGKFCSPFGPVSCRPHRWR